MTTFLFRRELVLKKPPKTSEVMAESLMRMLMDGPEVSLSGSPTVSPTTADLWASDPLTKVRYSVVEPWTNVLFDFFPDSMYFLALSQAPPVFEKEIAI
jgi:hypothetical protein